jgi:hypothetical protein
MHEDGARRAVPRFAGRVGEIARKLELEQIQGRVVDHHVSDLPLQSEPHLPHACSSHRPLTSAPAQNASSRSLKPSALGIA